jgi:hypothetical protein
MAGYRSDTPMQSLDARLAAHVRASGIPPTDVDEAIAQVVHDQGVDQAMRADVAAAVADGRDIAGVMGGASTPRDAPAYRLAAQTAKALSEAGFLVATGGGLGIMEAGNLGADFAGRPDDELHAAIDDLERWQKRQIARFARDGLSIPEIGARLFLSPRTVEWHLRKVFTKLEIRYRHELSAAFPSTESELAPA